MSFLYTFPSKSEWRKRFNTKKHAPAISSPLALTLPQSVEVVEQQPKDPLSAQSTGSLADGNDVLSRDLCAGIATESFLGARYLIPAACLPEKVRDKVLEDLTFRPKNPEAAYNASKKRKAGVCFAQWLRAALPGRLDAWAVPRAYGVRTFGFPPDKNDLRSPGMDIEEHRCVFEGTLRAPCLQHPDWPNQQKACEQVLAALPRHVGGFIKMSCGFGKTVIMVYLVTQLRKKTLVITSTEPQQKEARESFKQFAPRLRVGFIQQDRCDLDPGEFDVVLASIQTLQSPGRGFRLAQFVPFGVCFVDEAHHLAAETYCAVLQQLVSARSIIGMSATPRRQDGRTQLLFDLVGPVLYQEQRDLQPDTLFLAVRLHGANRAWNLQEQFMFDKKTPDRTNMLTDLASCAPRTHLAMQLLLPLLSANFAPPKNFPRAVEPHLRPSKDHPRRIMVLSHRLVLLEDMAMRLISAFPNLHWCCLRDRLYLGFDSREVLEKVASDPAALCEAITRPNPSDLFIGQLKGSCPKRLKGVLSALLGYMHVVMAIDELGGESFNVPEMDTQLLLTPSIDMEQRHGRVQRGKAANPPLIIDLFDEHGQLFRGMAQSRLREARAKGYQVHEMHVSCTRLPQDQGADQQPGEGQEDAGELERPRMAYLEHKPAAIEHAWMQHMQPKTNPS